MSLFGFKHRNAPEEPAHTAAPAAAPVQHAPAAAPVQPTPVAAAPAARPRQEMIAAISAALAEELGTDISGIRILSVKKV